VHLDRRTKKYCRKCSKNSSHRNSSPWWKKNVPKIAQPDRVFVREGVAFEEKQLKLLFLFNDSLLVTTKLESELWLFDKFILFDNCSIAETENRKIWLKIGGEGIIHLKFEKLEEKEKWYTDFSHVMESRRYNHELFVSNHMLRDSAEILGYLDLKHSEDIWFRHWIILENSGILNIFYDVFCRKPIDSINISDFFYHNFR